MRNPHVARHHLTNRNTWPKCSWRQRNFHKVSPDVESITRPDLPFHALVSALATTIFRRTRQARHPEVFVRDLSMAEGQKLQRITRTAKDPVKLRRAIVVLVSGQGRAVSDIVDLSQVDDGYVRDVIHAFNERGSTPEPKCSGGRPPATDKTTRQKAVALAKTDPHALGLPFSCWSLAKLTAHPRPREDHPGGPGSDPAHPAHQERLPDDHHVETVERPGLRDQDEPGPRPQRPSTRRRPSDRRVQTVVVFDLGGPVGQDARRAQHVDLDRS